MSAFDRLSPALAYQIVNTLRWPSLRPVQEQAIDAILDDKNVVVLAPTAGGKTEASFFPLLSEMDREDWAPVSVLYLSPIRALLNNQDQRVQSLAAMVGRRAFKWHGDVGQNDRRKFLEHPTDILLITPESLEAMLLSTRVAAGPLFSNLRAVIIDEIHAFADDDRGAHLAAVLERLVRYCGKDVQRIGLSATVGNPDEILRWVQGSSRRSAAVIDPRGERAEPNLSLDYVGSLENAARVVQELHPGKKRLVFLDSRAQAEKLGNLLNGLGVMTFVIHGSLSVTARRDAEHAFHEGQDCVIVATSALELGIDVGDLDHVLQVDSPPSVASFLQRLGRTGRRSGTVANCTFLVTKESAVLTAAAIIRLFREGYVEPVRPSRRAAHIYAQQVMALAVQVQGIPRGDIWAWLQGTTVFADLTAEERDAIVDHMLAHDLLADQGGRLWLGPVGEKRYGHSHFRELLAVFDSPRLVTVRAGAEDIGTIEATFLQSLHSASGPGSFMLAGRAWEVAHIDWERGTCTVKPAPKGRAPRWIGGARHLGHELCQAMRRVLLETEDDPACSQRARTVLSGLREEYEFLRDAPAPLIEEGEQIYWWTFAGGAANALLAQMLEHELGEKILASNTRLRLDGAAGKSLAAVREVLSGYLAQGRPTTTDALRFAEGASRSRVSKFQGCLPEELLAELTAGRAVDVEGARGAVREAIPY